MHILRTATIFLVMVGFYTTAYSQCDLTGFGKHEPPPAPLRSPPVEDQYANFEWGTDASTKGAYWWRWNFIKNDASLPLTADWVKGGIHLPIGNPLPAGEAACRKVLLGNSNQPVPVLDANAPIVYGVSSQTQDAAVFVSARPNQAPSVSQAPPSPAPSITLPSKTKESEAFHPTSDVFETVYRSPKGELVPIQVGVSSNKSDQSFSIGISMEPHDLFVALSGTSKFWSPDQLETIVNQFAKQGFKVFQAPLSKFATLDPVKQLHISPDEAEQNFLILTGGTEAQANYNAPPGAQMRYQAAVFVILDSDGRPVTGENIEIIVPHTDMSR